MTHNDSDRLKVLEQLEAGELDFDQALGELIGAACADPQSREWDDASPRTDQ